MRPMELYRQYGDEPYLPPRFKGNLGVQAQQKDEADAQASSEQLRIATIRAIMAQADRHGTDVDTAASFLLSKGQTPEALVIEG